MFCAKCGTQIAPGYNVCPTCGTPVANAQQPQVNPYQPAMQPARGFAIASLVLGIVSFFIGAIICGTLAIIFAIMAKKRGNKSPMATAGLICGIIGLALWVLILIFSAATAATFFSYF